MPWYVIRTKPQHEIKSATILEKDGLEVYCPVITEIRQWSDRRKKVTTPLFRSYLFVNLEERQKNLVFTAPGVTGFMNWLNKPAIAREYEIEALKSWMNNEKLDGFKVSNLKPGDKVEIKTGKLATRKAIIKETGAKKLKLILPDLGWTVSAKVQDLV